ncbi:single-stranded DNA-binding protein [Sphaerobacter thermophilus]|uniref:single-stranded DNA-binding protein n=1 Tax=Sphaerobacter thermophilus TaxID=2057 RepID=UPI000DB40D5B|nr:MAG: single-stranded DNA-binding protein [Sphaerobacter thermophilus]
MFQGLNRIQIIGNLGRDPEMRYTPGGSPVTNFSVAVNRRRRGQDDQWVDETDWFTVVCWERLAEQVDNMATRGFLTKGTKVYVEGRLQVRRYAGNDGMERTAVEIVANRILILSSRGEGMPVERGIPAEQAGGPDFGPPEDDFDDVPF